MERIQSQSGTLLLPAHPLQSQLEMSRKHHEKGQKRIKMLEQQNEMWSRYALAPRESAHHDVLFCQVLFCFVAIRVDTDVPVRLTRHYWVAFILPSRCSSKPHQWSTEGILVVEYPEGAIYFTKIIPSFRSFEKRGKSHSFLQFPFHFIVFPSIFIEKKKINGLSYQILRNFSPEI